MIDPLTHPNYCPSIFKTIHISENSQGISPGYCCVSKLGPQTANLDFYSNDFLSYGRTNWQNEKLSNCQQCWNNESNNQLSQRLINIDQFKYNNQNTDPTTPELLHLDYSVGKLCNAKCIICGAHSSTTWVAEDYKFKGIKNIVTHFGDTVNSRIRNLDLSKLRSVYFVGGEPLMATAPVDILELVEKTGNISNLEFCASTNGSIVPDDRLANYWKKCKEVKLFVSIDATGDAFEYIRNPLKWEQVEDNLSYISNLGPNIHVHIALTLGLHNIDELENTYLWYKASSWQSERTEFTIAQCNGTYNLNNATNSLLNIWRDKITDTAYLWKDDVLRLLSVSGATNNNIWLSHLAQMDLRRNLNWQNSLSSLYNTYKSI